jgi:ribosome biogenesis GTPase
MQALDHNFNLNRLERYLVMLRECQIKPVVLLSKSDLCSSSAIQTALNLINNQHPNLSVFTFSNQTQTGLAQIKELFNKHHLYCLLGSSGVGKTTLVNHLIGQDQFKTQAVRHQDQRGKHTTSARQLIQLSNQAYLIDTPGMRELGHIELDTGLKNTFADIIEIASQCKFANCTHTSEQGCAIQKALTKKELSPKHFENYQKLQKESAYHSMSYYEKRSKDKEFGKMVKRVLKNKPHKHS